jgi:hypothetical protein
MAYHGHWYAADYRRKEPQKYVLAIADGPQTKAWGLEVLAESTVINDEWAGKPVLAMLDAEGFVARLYAREIKGRKLTFCVAGGEVTDLETGTIWAPATGRGKSGPMADEALRPLPAVVVFRNAWERFFPQS